LPNLAILSFRREAAWCFFPLAGCQDVFCSFRRASLSRCLCCGCPQTRANLWFLALPVMVAVPPPCSEADKPSLFPPIRDTSCPVFPFSTLGLVAAASKSLSCGRRTSQPGGAPFLPPPPPFNVIDSEEVQHLYARVPFLRSLLTPGLSLQWSLSPRSTPFQIVGGLMSAYPDFKSGEGRNAWDIAFLSPSGPLRDSPLWS